MSEIVDFKKDIGNEFFGLQIFVYHSQWHKYVLDIISKYLDHKHRVFEEACNQKDWMNPEAREYGQTEYGLIRLSYCACQIYINDVTSVLMKVVEKLKAKGITIPDSLRSKKEMRKRSDAVNDIFNLANCAKHMTEWSTLKEGNSSKQDQKTKLQEETRKAVLPLILDDDNDAHFPHSLSRFDINHPAELAKLFDIIDAWGRELYIEADKFWNQVKTSLSED